MRKISNAVFLTLMFISITIFLTYFVISMMEFASKENKPIRFLNKGNFYYEVDDSIGSDELEKSLVYGEVEDKKRETNRISLPYKIYLPEKNKKYSLRIELSFDTNGNEELRDLLKISYQGQGDKQPHPPKSNGIVQVDDFTGAYYSLTYFITLDKPSIAEGLAISNQKFSINVVFQAFEID